MCAGAPMVLLDPASNQVVKENETLRLTCLFTGEPTPILEWLFDEDMLLPCPTGGTIFSGVCVEDNSVIIPSMGIENEGQYSCTAVNSAGFAAYEISLRLSSRSKSILIFPSLCMTTF